MSLEARFSLPAVLDAIGLERGILLGHSDGGFIAAIYAGDHMDERIKGLILMAPRVFTEEMGLAAIAEARRAYATGDLRARLAKYHAHVDSAFFGWNGGWLDPGFKAWNIEEAVAAGAPLRFSFRARRINMARSSRSAPSRPARPPPSRA